MNDNEYKDWANQQKPDKKSKRIKISLCIVILILLGFLAWIYLITPAVQAVYIQGQDDVIMYQTQNAVIVYVDQNGEVQIDPLVEFCPTFTEVNNDK